MGLQGQQSINHDAFGRTVHSTFTATITTHPCRRKGLISCARTALLNLPVHSHAAQFCPLTTPSALPSLDTNSFTRGLPGITSDGKSMLCGAHRVPDHAAPQLLPTQVHIPQTTPHSKAHTLCVNETVKYSDLLHCDFPCRSSLLLSFH